MNWKTPLFFLGRLAYATFMVITAVYCVLVFLPFTYQQVHVGGLLPWLTTFVRIHPYLNVLAVAVLVPTMLTDLHERRSRLLTIILFAISAVGAIALFVHPLLANLTNDASSLIWCLVTLVPLVLVGACDWLAHASQLKWRAPAAEESRLFQTAVAAALFGSLLYAVIMALHAALGTSAHLTGRQWFWSLLWSVLSQALVFMGTFLGFALVGALGSVAPKRRAFEVALVMLLATAILWWVFRAVVFVPLSFRGWQADGMALALGFAIVVFFLGTNTAVCRATAGSPQTALELLFSPLQFLRDRGLAWRIPFFVVVAALAYWLATASVSFDWAYVLQHLVVLWLWLMAFAAFYMLAPFFAAAVKPKFLYLAAGAVLVSYVGLQLAQPRHQASAKPSEAAALVDEYANYDVSFRLADEVLSSTAQGNSADQDTAGFYSFLAENTDVARSRKVDPVDINLVANFAKTGAHPNIFVIVIDSLRRDYLGAYNPAVTFTPNFDAFAHDSVVMENAFTHYGGTGLAEPSIWLGGMMLHKQYIKPFEPMNTLKKLVDAEGYNAYISKDTILQTVLGPAPELHELDADIGTMNYNLCKTLNEVTTRFPAAGAPPLFVYTQPQNIHVSVIDREGRSVPPGETYPTVFDAPYASRVAQMDRCFGSFIDALKKAGLYDESVIIITADHGDSLGEHGRWGHAYTLFPEIVRVPLVVHLPASMKSKLAYDTKSVAFTTDISPSLYYLLGEKPANDPMLGRPLFTADLAEQQAYARDSYLVVSSYAPVYGVLDAKGRMLYIADGVNYRDYYYDLAEDPHGAAKPVTDDVRQANEARIRKLVLQIARFYRLP